MTAKAWRINPRDDYGQLSLGDIGNAGGGYVVVAVPTGMDDEYVARLMAASELMAEALGSAEMCISNHSDDVERCSRCRLILDQIQSVRTLALGHELAIAQILEYAPHVVAAAEGGVDVR